jgi:hypothetical protein
VDVHEPVFEFPREAADLQLHVFEEFTEGLDLRLVEVKAELALHVVRSFVESLCQVCGECTAAFAANSD